MVSEVQIERRTQESGFQSLAGALFLSRDWNEIPLMALAAYFDASGHKKDQEFLVVAGFVSSVSDWVSFDEKWKARLERDDLPYFHANEFAQSVGAFENGWKDEAKRRESLCADLMEIIKSHAYRQFGHVVINKVLEDNMSAATKAKYKVSPFSLAGRSCAASLRLWLKRDGWNTVPELIFEDGDLDRGFLIDALVRDGFAPPIFRPGRDRETKDGLIIEGLTPLQAADWLAYEIFKASKAAGVYRWPMIEFLSSPGHLGIYEIDDVKALEIEMNTPFDQILKPIPGNQFFVRESKG
jgi:hypothetical protein